VRGRRRESVQRVQRHPVHVDIVRRPAGRRLRADCAPNAESHFKPDAQAYTDSYAAADAHAQQAADAGALAEANTAAHAHANAVAVAAPDATTVAAPDHHAWRPDGAPNEPADATAYFEADAPAHAKPDAEADASPDAEAHAAPHADPNAFADAAADARAVAGSVAQAYAAPIALADRDARKSDGGARLRSNTAADAAPDGQSDGSSGLLLLHRRLRRVHGAVDGPGLLERKISVRDLLRSLVCWILARTAASDAVARGHAGICRVRRPRLRRHHVRNRAG